MPLGQGYLSVMSNQSPLGPGLVFARGAGVEVSEPAAKYDLCRAEACERVRGVPVGQQGTAKGICVQGATRAQAVMDETLC